MSIEARHGGSDAPISPGKLEGRAHRNTQPAHAAHLAVGSPARLALARGARLRADRHGPGALLLYPERALVLNASAAAIAELLDGTRTADQIVAEMVRRYRAEPDRVQPETEQLLRMFAARGLLRRAGS